MIDLKPIQRLERNMKRAIINLPTIMGNEALNFAADNFRQGGFTNTGFQKWRARKDPNKWGAVKRPGRALLVDSGRLRRAGTISQVSQQGVTLRWQLPYARVHNEGLKIGQIQTVKSFTRTNGTKVRTHTRRVNQSIPQRQFIGKSRLLQQRVVRHGMAHIMKNIK